MIILTGAAGFICSAYLWKLNDRGIKDILIVDEADISDRKVNLAGKSFTDYLDKENFIRQVRQDKLPGKVSAVVHIGACSSTTESNSAYLTENNFAYTRDLCLYCLSKGASFLYASSAATYGDGSEGYDDAHERIPLLKPLNLYGQSKQDFDLWALKQGLLDQITGFKFFNVYGPNEYHKGEMKSVIAKSYDTVAKEKKMRLFKSYRPEYGDGEQKRDFIYVKDTLE